MTARLRKSVPEPRCPQAVLRTPRLTLRLPQPGDAAAIARHAGDPRVAQGTRALPHPLTAETAQALVAAAITAEGDGEATATWVIDGGTLGTVLGGVTLSPVAPGQCELEFWVAPEAWNTGIATEAVAALVAENPRACTSMVAEAFQDSPGSARVLTHCGFDYLGDAESWCAARGRHVPTWTYARRLR